MNNFKQEVSKVADYTKECWEKKRKKKGSHSFTFDVADFGLIQ